MDTTIVDETESASIEYRNGASWVKLSIRLAEDFTGGTVVRLAPGARVALEAGDDLSSTYTTRNWFSGIASGAFYAYRTLKVPRRVVLVTNLAGRLGSGDIQVLAHATARMVADILHGALPRQELAGWQVLNAEVSKNGVKSA